MKYIEKCVCVHTALSLLNDIGNGIPFLLFNVVGDGNFYRTHNTIHT